MTKKKFMNDLQEELELETILTESTNIKELDEWDSMSAMILIGYVTDNFDVNLNTEDLKNITTINSLVDRIGGDKFN
jgi:acyl carrier protein